MRYWTIELALQARGEEIQVLIRDGNPSVLVRLLDCPRLAVSHVVTMLHNPNLSTRVISAIKKNRKWVANVEGRYLICVHPTAVLSDAIEQLRMLPPDRIRRIVRDPAVRAQIKSKAREIENRKAGGGRR